MTNITNLPIPMGIGAALAALPRKKFSDYGLPDDLTYAGVVLEADGRHKLVLGDRFEGLTPIQQGIVLMHEYTHVAFGHPLLCSQLKLNPGLFNIAADAWINHVHPHKVIQDLGGILYDELREGMPAKAPCKEYPEGIPARDPIPELPEYLIDPVAIYKVLKEKVIENFMNSMDTLMSSDLTEKANARAGLEVLKARMVIQEAAKEDPSLRKLSEELMAGTGKRSNLYTDVRISDWLERIYKQLHHLASGGKGERIRKRGWHRPARIEGYKGTARRPGLHVMVAIDVSGSSAGWWDDIIAACRGIAKHHRVEIACHNSEIVYHGAQVPAGLEVGGGTAFAPVVKLAERVRPNCLIWVTDGESSDQPTLPDCPVYWVWLEGARKWPLRQQDYETMYER